MLHMLECWTGSDTTPSNSLVCTHLLLAPLLLIHLGPPALSCLPLGSLSVDVSPSCLQGKSCRGELNMKRTHAPLAGEGGTAKWQSHMPQDLCRAACCRCSPCALKTPMPALNAGAHLLLLLELQQGVSVSLVAAELLKLQWQLPAGLWRLAALSRVQPAGCAAVQPAGQWLTDEPPSRC